MLKRLFDLVVSGVLLVILSPVLSVVAVLVARNMGSPVLFRQQRPGLHGKPFEMLKFRTMRDGAGSDAERLTGLGKLLRSTSLDELPELWNILKGDMSFVGPRPLLMDYLPLYSEEQARRHDVRPGLTGWAQVNGRNAIDWKRKFELDLWYVENRSFWLDLKIMAMTAAKIVAREGIDDDGGVGMERFRGN